MMPHPIRELGSCLTILNALAQVACLRLRSFARSLSAAGWCLVFVKAKARNRVQAQPAGGMMPRPIRELGSCLTILNALAQIACLRLRSFVKRFSIADDSLVFVKAKARNCLWAQPTGGMMPHPIALPAPAQRYSTLSRRSFAFGCARL